MSYRTSITALALLAAAPLAAQEPARTIVIRPGFNGQRTYTVDGGMMA